MEIKEKFKKYAEMLREKNAVINLVAPSTLADIETRHLADSMQLADFLPRDKTVVDMGSGAGFPGVVLAILGYDVMCVESVGKKANFLRELKQELDLPNLEIYHGRLENFIKSSIIHHPSSIVFTARAFAPLTKILDYVKPVKNSRLFLLKGREIESEIIAAKGRHKFDYKLYPSKTGDGKLIEIRN